MSKIFYTRTEVEEIVKESNNKLLRQMIGMEKPEKWAANRLVKDVVGNKFRGLLPVVVIGLVALFLIRITI